jgi:hypothetical protein
LNAAAASVCFRLDLGGHFAILIGAAASWTCGGARQAAMLINNAGISGGRKPPGETVDALTDERQIEGPT